MMRHISLALVAAGLSLSACNFISYTGENTISDALSVKAGDTYRTERYDSTDFHEVKLQIPAKVVYTPGRHLVEINAPDNYFEYISVSNRNGVLDISTDLKRTDSPITLTLGSSRLSELTIKGANEFYATEGIVSDGDFSAEVSGAANIRIDSLKASSVELEINGAADFCISGISSTALDVKVKGAANGILAGKVVEYASVFISGTGCIDVRNLTSGNLHTSVKGVGVIRRND